MKNVLKMAVLSVAAGVVAVVGVVAPAAAQAGTINRSCKSGNVTVRTATAWEDAGTGKVKVKTVTFQFSVKKFDLRVDIPGVYNSGVITYENKYGSFMVSPNKVVQKGTTVSMWGGGDGDGHAMCKMTAKISS